MIKPAFLSVLIITLLAQEQPVLKIGARLVQFNVIVRDRHGPVSGLKQEDFTLTDRGVRRKIAVFRIDSRLLPPSSASNSTGSGHPSLPANVFSNRQAVEPNSAIIVFDGLNTRFSDQALAKRRIIEFLEHLHPGDRIGLCYLGRKFRVIHDLSQDATSLIEAARNLRIRMGSFDDQLAGAAMDAEMAKAASASKVLGEMMEEINAVNAESSSNNQAKDTELAMIAIARYFASIPGRKSLIWVSSGFPINIGGTSDTSQRYDSTIAGASSALMSASVAVYPVDARGLVATVDKQWAALETERRSKSRFGSAEQETMIAFAERTGGIASFNTNDIEGAIRRALDDSEVTYTLGFYLPQDEMDSRFHETRITVARKGLEVRSRKGYVAFADAAPTAATREVVMRQALFASLDATALPITIRLDAAPEPGAINVTAALDPKSLVFSPGDGQFSTVVDFVIAQQAADGRNLKIDAEVLNMSYNTQRYRRMIERDLELKRHLQLDPQTRMIRVIFYDRNSGLIGSARGPAHQQRRD